MAAISTVMRVSSSGIVLIALCNMPQAVDMASAANEAKEGPGEIQISKTTEPYAMRESHMITGEILREDGANFVVKEKGGNEVRVWTDEGTAKPLINQGDHISADVDDQNYALWIRANRGTDRRAQHASAIKRKAIVSITDRR